MLLISRSTHSDCIPLHTHQSNNSIINSSRYIHHAKPEHLECAPPHAQQPVMTFDPIADRISHQRTCDRPHMFPIELLVQPCTKSQSECFDVHKATITIWHGTSPFLLPFGGVVAPVRPVVPSKSPGVSNRASLPFLQSDVPHAEGRTGGRVDASLTRQHSLPLGHTLCPRICTAREPLAQSGGDEVPDRGRTAGEGPWPPSCRKDGSKPMSRETSGRSVAAETGGSPAPPSNGSIYAFLLQ